MYCDGVNVLSSHEYLTNGKVTGSVIESSTVGLTTPAAGKFTNLDITGALTVAAIDATPIGQVTPAAGDFLALAGTTGDFSSTLSGTEVTGTTSVTSPLYKVAGDPVLSAGALGSTILSSSLTSLGTITTLMGGTGNFTGSVTANNFIGASATITADISAATVNSVLAAEYVVAEDDASAGTAQPYKMQRLTFSQYVALGTPDANTLYIVIGA